MPAACVQVTIQINCLPVEEAVPVALNKPTYYTSATARRRNANAPLDVQMDTA
jgi:hypothetical protein